MSQKPSVFGQDEVFANDMHEIFDPTGYLWEQCFDLPQRFLNQHLSALGTDPEFVSTIPTSFHGPGGRQITAIARGELDDESANRCMIALFTAAAAIGDGIPRVSASRFACDC